MATLAPKSNRKSRSTLHLQTSQVSLNTNPSHRQQSTLAPPQHQGRSISRNGSSLHIFPSRSNSRLAPGRSNSRLIPGGRSTTARPARSSSRLSISHDDPVYTPAVPPPPPPPTLRDIAIVNHGPIVTQLEQDLIHATSTGDLDAVYECIWKAAECGGLKCASAVVSSLEEGGSGRHAGGSAGGGGGHMGRRNAISPRRWNLSRATTKAIPHPEGEGRRRRASSVGTARFNAKSCNINCRIPFMGTSPLSLVCKSGLPLCAKIANVLLEFGADATDADNYGVTPLHWAAEKGSEVLIQRLIQHLNERFLLAHSKLAGPANERVIQAIGKKDLFGSTPLHFAAVNNRLKVVEALLLAGADPTAVNNDGRKPSDVCSDPDVRSILIGEATHACTNGSEPTRTSTACEVHQKERKAWWKIKRKEIFTTHERKQHGWWISEI
ncbi:ankyrin repeat-containing domain protein [Cladochytrium replicatum]|nr:ankyrin repeat-containing domain protein [Cladochytrium replicatum]